MPDTLWLQDGKILVDSDGNAILCDECPCGDCCDKAIKWLLSHTGNIRCDLDPNSHASDGYTTMFVCGKSITVPTSQLQVSNWPVAADADDVSEQNTLHIIKAFCDGDTLHPVIMAPNMVDGPTADFNIPRSQWCAPEWDGCPDFANYSMAACCFQVVAPMCWFDDAKRQNCTRKTLTWGVVGCWCTESGKYVFESRCNYDAPMQLVFGLMVIDSTCQLEPQTINGVTYNCRMDCESMKSMIDAYFYALPVREDPPNPVNPVPLTSPAARMYEEVGNWNYETGRIQPLTTCFCKVLMFDFGWMSTVKIFSVNGTYIWKWMFYMVDCECDLYQWGASVTPNTQRYWSAVEVYLVNDTDAVFIPSICDHPCRELFALQAVAHGKNWKHSDFTYGTDDGLGGVIVTRDPDDDGSQVMSLQPGETDVNGSPEAVYMLHDAIQVKFACWKPGKIFWVGCCCEYRNTPDGCTLPEDSANYLSIECACVGTAPPSMVYLTYKDACFCLDYRDLALEHPSFFGCRSIQQGSHTIVRWTLEDPQTHQQSTFDGPYWPYYTYGQGTGHTLGGFVDWNMVVVHRVVSNTKQEVGHVKREGRIENKYDIDMNTIVSVTFVGYAHIMEERAPGEPLNYEMLGMQWWCGMKNMDYSVLCPYECNSQDWQDCYNDYMANPYVYKPFAVVTITDYSYGDTFQDYYADSPRPSYHASEVITYPGPPDYCELVPASEDYVCCCCCIIPTSCGFLLKVQGGTTTVDYVDIIGYSEVMDWARQHVPDFSGYGEQVYHYHGPHSFWNYPEHTIRLCAPKYKQRRNRHGSLISWCTCNDFLTAVPSRCSDVVCSHTDEQGVTTEDCPVVVNPDHSDWYQDYDADGNVIYVNTVTCRGMNCSNQAVNPPDSPYEPLDDSKNVVQPPLCHSCNMHKPNACTCKNDSDDTEYEGTDTMCTDADRADQYNPICYDEQIDDN